MNKIRLILLDALILFAVSTVFVVFADRAFSGLKGKIPKDDPVVTAIGQGQIDGLRASIALLEKDPKVGAKVALKTDEHGRTSLMRAAYANLVDAGKLKEADDKRTEMIGVLLEHGALIDAVDHDGWTALMWACWSGMPATVDRLLESGASPAAADAEDNTALIIAAQRGHAGIVKALLAKGADRSARNKAGKTALAAAETGFAEHPANQYPELESGYQAVLAALR
ncbi:MAG: ankyrin repeat domain-containing protein [Akkermansiaceae bacterium]|nr:ankyrin repeat domain-containing protein [Akkermansiaceae bacterium]MCF7732686.1 ankyrin repeat domain-containing protein [Akkermansiaceae bacterium]